MEIPALPKKITIVSVDNAFQAETKNCIAFKIKTSGRALFFFKLLMTFWTIFLRHFAFNDLMRPWSIDCVVDVVFCSNKNNLIDFKFLIWGYAGQLSITSATFLPSDENFRSNSRTHSSNNTPSIQLFFDVAIGKVKTLCS